MTVFGVDHAWGTPGPAALKAAGAKFVCRYLSHTPSKNLSPVEARTLSDNGIWVVVVWETAANRALSGYSAGQVDARFADAQAKTCGMPVGRPIYFAVDWDASSGQQTAINAYLDGAASVLGRGRVGMYAGYGPIRRAFDAHKITFGWQTYAWSRGQWDKRAQLQQYSNDHVINGVGCDYNRATHDDYGQWRVGVSPQKEDDMEPTTTVTVPDYWKGKNFTHDKYSAAFLWAGNLSETRAYGKAVLAKLEAQQVTIDKLVDALAGAQPDLDALKATIKEAIESIDIKIDVPEAPDA